MNIYQGKIPFDKDGNLCAYAGGFPKPVAWEPNAPFEATLKFLSYGRGRSSVTFQFEDQERERKLDMFVSSLSDAMPHIIRGTLKGTFAFEKKGSNYGVRLLHGEKPSPEWHREYQCQFIEKEEEAA